MQQDNKEGVSNMAENMKKPKKKLSELESSQEIDDLLNRLTEARQSLSPEETSAISRIDTLRKEAKDLYKERANRSEWLSLAERIGRSLAQLGAAQEGMSRGVDVSGFNPGELTDYDSKIGRYKQEYMQDLGQFEKAEQGIRQQSQERFKTEMGGLGERLKEARSRRTLEAKEEGIGSYQQPIKRFSTGGNLMVKSTGNPAIFNAETGEYIDSVTRQPVSSGDVRPQTTGSERAFGPGLTPEEEKSVPASRVAFDRLPDAGKKRVEKLADQFSSESSDLRGFIRATNQAEELANLAQRNPVAEPAIGAKMADIFEPGGRKTDEDVKRYVTRKGISQRVLDTWELMKTGTITPDKAGDMLEVIEVLGNMYRDEIQEKAVTKAKQITNTYGGKAEDIAPIIYGDFQEFVADKKTRDDRNEKINKFTEANPDMSRDQIIRALRKMGEIE